MKFNFHHATIRREFADQFALMEMRLKCQMANILDIKSSLCTSPNVKPQILQTGKRWNSHFAQFLALMDVLAIAYTE